MDNPIVPFIGIALLAMFIGIAMDASGSEGPFAAIGGLVVLAAIVGVIIKLSNKPK